MEFLADTFNEAKETPNKPSVKDENYLNGLVKAAFIIGFREGEAEGWSRALNALFYTSYKPVSKVEKATAPVKQEEIQNDGTVNPDYSI